MTKIRIKRAIVSVHNKRDLSLLAEYFLNYDVEVLSTGGTAKFLKKYNQKIKITDIADFTNYNEILNGRVKSLHPMIHSGILARKNNKKHENDLKKINVPYVDLVVVNLYPFEKVSQNLKYSQEDCIENIDIGGPTLIRGAAKNYDSVTVLTSPNQYQDFLKEVNKNKNLVTKNFRRQCAKIAFETTAYYESLISQWFNKDNDSISQDVTAIPIKKISVLRYGENPHQKASVYRFGKNNFLKVSGKDLSYNNICDAEIAAELANHFTKSSCVILKHGNPCGVALDDKQEKAYMKALKCDRISAFGGVVAFNKTLSLKTATQIDKIFTEIVVAPQFTTESLELLKLKKNLILIRYRPSKIKTLMQIKSTNNFLLIQDKDNKIISRKELVVKTNIKPKKNSIDDMIFGFIISKYINSNAIVLANELSTVGIGVGQTSRLDSAYQAIKKMNDNFKKINPIMASDGFFPFPDIVDLCSTNNIIGIIQPGGSKNDKEVIISANHHKIPLVFTGVRHFKH